MLSFVPLFCNPMDCGLPGSSVQAIILGMGCHFLLQEILIQGWNSHLPHWGKILLLVCLRLLNFPGGSEGKESACNAGDSGSIPGLWRSPREGTGYPLQHSYLENSLDIGAWQTTVHGVTKGQTQLSNIHFTLPCLNTEIPKIIAPQSYANWDTQLPYALYSDPLWDET